MSELSRAAITDHIIKLVEAGQGYAEKAILEGVARHDELAEKFMVALMKSDRGLALNDIPDLAWDLAEKFTEARLDHIKAMEKEYNEAVVRHQEEAEK